MEQHLLNSVSSPTCCHLQALHTFRAAGKQLLFVTNNSSKSRQEYVEKFASLGFEVSVQEVSELKGRVSLKGAAVVTLCTCGTQLQSLKP